MKNTELQQFYRKAIEFYDITSDIDIQFAKMEDFGTATMPSEGTIEIRIRKGLEGKELYTTVLHELTHAKQFDQDGFDMFADGVIHWKGETYTKDTWSYKNQPWEIEAVAMEKLLYKVFKPSVQRA